ncbi:MAG TPA: FliM/FliN family flagellar motor switch protein [Candidatus Acidoferrales bacterium]|nr:FliM/FliN family flagellar motor switch protein [Candidatus Acidoferrales bacterium]
MEKVLNQEEIDAMFQAALGTKGTVHSNETVKPCDFRQAGQIKKEQVQAITLLHESFARTLTHALGAYLRVIFETHLVSVEQLTFREFLARVPDISYLASFRVLPLGVTAAIQLDLSLAFPIIDLLLGGRGRSGTENREVTEIEEQILEGVVQILCQELQTAWASINVTFEFSERLSPTQMQRLMPPTDKTLCLSFEIRMPDSRGMLNVSLPAVVSNLLLRTLDRDGGYDARHPSPEAMERMREHARDFRFLMDLSLPPTKVPVAEIINLKPGDILSLPRAVAEPAIAYIASTPVFTAGAVRSGSQRAAQIANVSAEAAPPRQLS